MRGTITLFILLTFQVLSAQDSLFKKIIYNDLVLLNNTYNKVFFQAPHSTVSDSINYSKYVDIIEVDTVYRNFFVIKVKFTIFLMPNEYYMDILDSSFTYVVYKTKNRLLKINGFMCSEILATRNIGWEYMSNEHKKIFFTPIKKRQIIRSIHKHDVDKIREHLQISILKHVSTYTYKLNSYPYVVNWVWGAEAAY